MGKKLKVSIGSKFIDGPYGGGNLFVKNLSKYLLDNNVDVVYDLNDIDIDIILIVNPLKNSEMSTFNHLDAYYYKQYINKESIILQRINECDERKNTNNVNSQIMNANQYADYTIYVLILVLWCCVDAVDIIVSETSIQTGILRIPRYYIACTTCVPPLM